MNAISSNVPDPAVVRDILERIADGASLTDIRAKHGVHPFTWSTWCEKDPNLAEAYAAARKAKADKLADDIVPLADSALGEPAANVQAIKNMVDARKWVAAKFHPYAYGDKLDVTSAGKALPTPTHQVDARVQSIVMMAAERMRLAGLDEVSDEVKGLLE